MALPPNRILYMLYDTVPCDTEVVDQLVNARPLLTGCSPRHHGRGVLRADGGQLEPAHHPRPRAAQPG